MRPVPDPKASSWCSTLVPPVAVRTVSQRRTVGDMEVLLLIVLVALFVAGGYGMKRAGWFDGGDDREIERARGSQDDQSAGPYG